jgi:hypothetical protein
MNAWNYFDESLRSTDRPAGAARPSATHACAAPQSANAGIGRRFARARRLPRAGDLKGWRASFITF